MEAIIREAHWPLWQSVAVAVGISSLLAAAAYVVFQMDELRTMLVARVGRRSIQAA